MKTRKTDYPTGTLLEIIETTFHGYKMGQIVKVLNADWHSYHVHAIDGQREWRWVNENQVKPISNETTANS